MPSKKNKKPTLSAPPEPGTLEPFLSKKYVRELRKLDIKKSKEFSKSSKEAWRRKKLVEGFILENVKDYCYDLHDDAELYADRLLWEEQQQTKKVA